MRVSKVLHVGMVPPTEGLHAMKTTPSIRPYEAILTPVPVGLTAFAAIADRDAIFVISEYKFTCLVYGNRLFRFHGSYPSPLSMG